MNKTTIDHQIEVLTAFRDGKTVKYVRAGFMGVPHAVLMDKDHLFDFTTYIYEVGKEPEYVPMCMEDFEDYPVVWVRSKGGGHPYLISGLSDGGIMFYGSGEWQVYQWDQPLFHLEWSPDRKNWRPFRKVKGE